MKNFVGPTKILLIQQIISLGAGKSPILSVINHRVALVRRQTQPINLPTIHDSNVLAKKGETKCGIENHMIDEFNNGSISEQTSQHERHVLALAELS